MSILSDFATSLNTPMTHDAQRKTVTGKAVSTRPRAPPSKLHPCDASKSHLQPLQPCIPPATFVPISRISKDTGTLTSSRELRVYKCHSGLTWVPWISLRYMLDLLASVNVLDTHMAWGSCGHQPCQDPHVWEIFKLLMSHWKVLLQKQSTSSFLEHFQIWQR